MADYIFVYGSLLKKAKNPLHNFLKLYATYIGNGYIYAKLYDLGEYPAAILNGSKRYKTYGEIYKIKPNLKNRLFKILDKYEGYLLTSSLSPSKKQSSHK